MENFNILKILTSAYDFFQKNNQIKKESGEQKKFDFNNLLKDFLSMPTIKEQPKQTIQKPKKQVLNEDMLKTIKSHDEFVKRVNENNKKES